MGGRAEKIAAGAADAPLTLHEIGTHFTHNLLDASVTVALLTIVVRGFWALASYVGRHLRFYLSPAIAQFPVELGPIPVNGDDRKNALAGLKVYCQIVRFGADDYIQNMASEQEKFEGRLQNKVLPVRMRLERDGYRGHLLLPVHRRLGTQFKMFLVTRRSDQARDLMEWELFKDPERHAKRRGRRISFVLKSMDKISNTEKMAFNNIVYPSNLHEFEKTNSFSWFYVAYQEWRYNRSARRRRR